jgi:hypothetical protein
VEATDPLGSLVDFAEDLHDPVEECPPVSD